MLKVNILERLIAGTIRYFKVNFRKNETKNIVQFTSGGEDYCPALNVEGLADYIGNNPAHGVIFAYRDNLEKKTKQGEKRIYSVEPDGETVSSEIWLKNNGEIETKTDKYILICQTAEITGDTNQSGMITAAKLKDNSGANGSFISHDNKIITVEDGIIRLIEQL